jgi:cyclopropane fatty-acyl-phospholipid synthase-like methyltransferase
MKPFAESCQQNRDPILEVLRFELADKSRLLEIGSGTGQHAVYFAPEFPQLLWQTSDVADMHGEDQWPQDSYDAVFSANTAHIMSWSQVECFIRGIGRVLRTGGVFCLYGPFNYNGQYTSESNARFDSWLRSRDPLSGVRDFEALDELARLAGLVLKRDYAMPANNRTLVWSRRS